MSEVIDSKVVELKFNNAEFEKNVKTSMNTLDQLKKSLTFDNVTKGITALTSSISAINLKSISSQVEELTGLVNKSVDPITSAVTTIGSAITNTIGGAITGVVNQIETGGINRSFKIEAAKFSLQGLGIEWNTVSDSINNAVSGTAYGLDQAAKAAAVLSASGIGVDKIADTLGDEGDTLPELERDLKAVSGIAAQTGQDFDQIADVFSTIANNGKVMTMQVRQFSNYGLNATADLAEYYGVATSDIDEMLKKGKISANDFFDMMYTKYWENAGKANETVTGVEANIKAALGRIGAAFISPIVENKGPLNQFLNAYMKGINTVASKLKQIGAKDEDGNLIEGKLTSYVDKNVIKYMNRVTKWLDDFSDPKKTDGILRIWRSVYRFLKGTFKLIQSGINYLEKIAEAFKSVFPKSLQTYLLRVAKIWTEFTNSIYRGSKDVATRGEVFNRFKDIFTGLAGIFKFVKRLLKSVVQGFKEFYNELPEQPLKMFTEAFANIGDLFKKFKPQASAFKNIFKGLWTVIGNVATIYLAFITAVIETMQDLDIHPLEFIGKVFKTLFGGLDTDTKKLNRLKNTLKIFTTVIGIVAKVLGSIILVAAKVINVILKIGTVVTYIISPIAALVNAIFGFGVLIGKTIIDKIKTFIKAFGGIKNVADKAKNSVETFVDNVITSIDNLKKYVSEGFENVDFDKYENLKRLGNEIKNAWEKAKEKVSDAIDTIKEKFSGASSDISGEESNVITTALDKIFTAFDNIAGVILTVRDNIGKLITKITDLLKPAVDDIADAFSSAFGKNTQDDIDSTKTKLEETGDVGLLDSIGSFFGKITDAIKQMGSMLGSNDAIQKAGESIGSFFGDLSSTLLEEMGLDEDASVFDILIGSVKLVAKFISDLANAVVDGLIPTVEKLGKLFMTQEWNLVLLNFLLIVKNVILMQIGFAIVDMASTFRNLSVALKRAKYVHLSTRVSNLITSFGNFVLALAGSVAILVGSLAGIIAISKWATPDEINWGLDILKRFILIMTGAAAIIALLVGKDSRFLKETTTLSGEGLSINKTKSGIQAMANFVLAFSGSIGILALALAGIVKIVSDENVWESDIDKALEILTGLMVALGIIMIAMVGLQKTSNTNGVPDADVLQLKFVAPILAFSVGVGLLVGSFKEIYNVVKDANPDDLMTAGIILGSIALAVGLLMGACIALQNKMSAASDINKIVSSGIILSISYAISQITNAFSKIVSILGNENISTADVEDAEAILGAMALGLAGIMISLSMISSKATLNTNISQAMQILQLGMIQETMRMLVNMFEDLLVSIENSDDDSIKATSAIMASMAGGLLTILLAFKSLQKGTSIKYDWEGLATLLASGSMFMLGMWAMINMFKDLLNDIMWADIPHIQEAEKIVAGMAVALGGIIGEMTILAKIASADAGNTLLGEGLLALMGGAFIAAIWKLIDLFDDLIEEIEDVDTDKVTEAKETFIGMIAAYGSMLAAITGSSTLKGLVGSITGGQSYIGDLVTALSGGVLYLAITKLSEAFSDFLGDIEEVDAEKIDAAGKTFEKIIESYSTLLSDESDSATLKGLAGAVTGFLSFAGDLVNLVKGGKIYELIVDLLNTYKRFIKKTSGYTVSQIETSTKTFKSIISAYIDLVEALDGIHISNIDADDLADVVEDLMDAYVDTIQAMISPDPNDENFKPKPSHWDQVWSETFKTSETSMNNELNANSSDIEDVGENMTKGVANGMTTSEAEESIKNAGEQVIDWAVRYSKQAADEHSPSKLMRDTVGKNLTAGIAVGMAKYVQPIKDSAIKVTDVLIKSLTDAKEIAINTISDVSGDLTLTPVVDMSNINNAAGQINDLFSNQSMSFNSDISGIQSSMQQIQNQDPNAELMSAINGLKDNINNNYTSYNVNGITYDDGSNIASAVQDLINATNIQGRM